VKRSVLRHTPLESQNITPSAKQPIQKQLTDTLCVNKTTCLGMLYKLTKEFV